MKVGSDYWLEGVRRVPLRDGGMLFPRRFLVIHFTAGWTGDSSIEAMRERRLSAHLVIDRDGKITQCVPFNRVAFHAGSSAWRDPKTNVLYRGLNHHAIGIELANCGDLVRDTYPSTLGALAGKKIPRLTAPHKHGGPARDWEIYPSAQLAACEMVSKVLVERFNLDDVVGHENISPGRKTDPGPAFPLEALRKACGIDRPLVS